MDNDNDNDKLAALVAKGDVPEDLLSWIAHCLDGMDSDKELYDSLSQSWGLMGEELFNHLAYSYNILIAWRAYHEQIRGLDKGLQVTVLIVAIEAAKEKVSPSAVLEEGFTEDGSLADNEYGEIIRRAFASRDRYLDAFERTEKLPKIDTKSLRNITLPRDKVNKDAAWEDQAGLPHDENGLVPIRTEPDGCGQEATVFYGVSFDELEEYVKGISRLTKYDKKVYVIVWNLYHNNGERPRKYITINQIYATMKICEEDNKENGKKDNNKAAKDQINRINDSLNKMALTRITLDNSGELSVYKNLKLFKVIEEYLLPFKRIKAVAGGNVTDAIYLYEEPPLMRFAMERKHVFTIPLKVYQVPLNQTENNIALEDYLLLRTSDMKGKGKSGKSHNILWTTLYKRLGIDGADSAAKKARTRIKASVRTCLDHFLKEGYINGYTETRREIIIDP